MQHPKSLEKCPIVDALVELKFNSAVPSTSVFGYLYPKLCQKFPNVAPLPEIQIPEEARILNPAFRFKPHYRLSNEDFTILVGPDVLTIGSNPKYAGWDRFSIEILEAIDILYESGVIKEAIQVVVRYINFFDNNIFENINFNLSFGSQILTYENTNIQTEFDKSIFKCALLIGNNAVVNNGEQGSIVDVAMYKNLDGIDFKSTKESLLSLAHDLEKEIFFELLNSDFLNSLKPIY